MPTTMPWSSFASIWVHTTQHNNTPHAEICITDNGTGIAPEIKGRIVEQHKGSIDVQTQVGTGTTVTVVLPYAT